MYKDELLDLYRNPRNEGSLETVYEAESENPSCGDETKFYLEVEDETIEEVRHQTEGCAICTASNSIVSEQLKGTSLEELKSLDREWMLEQLDIDVSPMRMKCAMLGLKTAKKAKENGEH